MTVATCDVLDDLPPVGSDGVPNHDEPNIADKTVERIAKAGQGEPLWDSYNQNQRLVEDEPSPTIIGKEWKYAHYEENRPLTVRERATLQSFPIDYEFTGGIQSQRLQVANAVPPKLAAEVASEI